MKSTGVGNGLLISIFVWTLLVIPEFVYAQSCDGKCGGYAGSCWCDSACTGYGDCCGDYQAVCANPAPDPPSDSSSCVGKCGGYAGSCYCDTACTGYGDCCSDYNDLCTIDLPQAIFTAETAHFSGTSSDSYFFLDVRQGDVFLSYLKVTLNFQGQNIRAILPAKTILPPSPEDALLNLVQNGAVSLAIDGVLGEIPGASTALTLLKVFAEFSEDLQAANNDGATSLVISDELGAGKSARFFIWTHGNTGLTVSSTIEFAQSPNQTIQTQFLPLGLNTGPFDD